MLAVNQLVLQVAACAEVRAKDWLLFRPHNQYMHRVTLSLRSPSLVASSPLVCSVSSLRLVILLSTGLVDFTMQRNLRYSTHDVILVSHCFSLVICLHVYVNTKQGIYDAESALHAAVFFSSS